MSRILQKGLAAKPLLMRQVENVNNFGDVSVKPLMVGDEMTLLEITFPAGAGSPLHIHQHESLCYVVSGRIRVTVADEVFEMGAGDVCRHPRGVSHGIVGLEHAVVVEVKSPAQPLGQFLGLSEE